FETAKADIEFKDGRFSVVGTDKSIPIGELAAKYPKRLDVSHVTEIVPSAFPNGCHVAEVEIDPETGVVEVVRYASANDFGTVVNPMLVEGQIHGGVAQGLGQVLMENAQYDADGQLLTGSFMDYALPRASDTPREIGFASHPVPAKTNPLGAKGCGEAGCAGAMTCLTNAIVDALSEYGIRRFDMPASPERVWKAINSRKSGSGTDFR
ncbi:MAG TPA: molybdopterin cofactor-binding domain-containing protein, partial [Burkholderiales bacterium]|nr:molybdopterin cofactor-binding domain-containing protein [Burkholderiales bacterium]